jgi:hypothetical protein
MNSGGGVFSKLKSGASSLAGRAKSGASSLYSKGKGAATAFALSKMMPKMPGLPGLPGLPSAAGVKGMANNMEKQPIFAKIATLVVLSLFIGIFFMYIHKKEAAFGYNSIMQGLIVAAIVLAGVGLSFYLKFDIIDFIISSQTNILCIYFLISYAGLTSLLTPSGFFGNFFDIFIVIGQIISDPTTIFEKGFSLVIPIVFFIIPLLVLINNATKSIWLALLVFATSVGVVYVLYPKNSVNPIPGGAGFDLGSAACRENFWEIWKKSC